MTETAGGAPLAGVRVVDFGQWFAAPMASMLLADQGATVVRVVRPDGPELSPRRFRALHRNKRIVTLDLASTPGREAAIALAAEADVTIEGFRPGVMERLGLGVDTLVAANPALVHLSLPGFSAVDDRAGHRAWESVIAAATGLFTDGLRQGLGLAPVFHSVPVASAFGAAHGAIAVLAALTRRLGDGRGATIEVPLAEAALSACTRSFVFVGAGPRSRGVDGRVVPEALVDLVDHPDPSLVERRLGQLVPPNYTTHHYRTADDRRMLIMPIKPGMAARYLRLLGIEAEVVGAGFVNESPWQPVDRGAGNNLASSWTMTPENNRWMIDRVGAAIATRTAAEWEARFADAGIPCATKRTRDDWLALAENREAGLVVPVGSSGDDQIWVAGRLADLGDGRDAPAVRFAEPLHVDPADAFTDVRDRPVTPPSRGRISRKADLLAGIRILDVCNVVAGPNAAYTLAQFGADVVRVEPPTSFNLPMHHGWVLEVNQGKRSIVVDTATAPGQTVFDRLVASADLVVHNRLDDVASRLGLMPEQLQRVNSDVVVAQISAYGGTRRIGTERRAGYDPMPNLATGLDVRLGSDDRPRQFYEILSDLMGGLSGAFGALLGLYHRQATGEALEARGSLARGAGFFQAPWMVSGSDPTDAGEAAGPGSRGTSWNHRLYRCRDGWLMIAAADDADRLARVTGVGHSDDMTAALETAFAGDDVDAWIERLDPAIVGAHRVVSIDDLCDPDALHEVANAAVDDVATGRPRILTWPDHPSGIEVVLPDPAWVRVGPDRSIRRLAPTPVVGHHTREVLAELGFDPAEIDELYRLRVAHDHLPAIADAATYFFEPVEAR